MDVPVGEDPHPAEDEHEVVRRERGAAEHEERGIRVPQVVARVLEASRCIAQPTETKKTASTTSWVAITTRG